MKSTLTLLFFIALVFGSCQENQQPEISLINNHFAGTFERRTGNEPGEVAQVSLSLQNNAYEGASNLARYPAICNGTYKIVANKIKFENGCFWTADFDWSLILNGEYTIQRYQDTVILIREMGIGQQKITDIYTLNQVLIQTN